jgi:hypothetical protein
MVTPPPTPSSPYAYGRLIEETAPSERARAKEILDALKQSRSFKWNPKTGVVRVNGRREPGSNIKAILADTVANKRQLSTNQQFDLVSTLLMQ